MAKKKPICAFTVAYGRPDNLVWAGMMINSFKRFHPDIPMVVFSDEDVGKITDPRKTYRLYAQFGKQLSKEYECVMQIDSDSIVTGSLDHLFKDKEVELACPLNNNLIDNHIMIHDIPWQVYVNAGLVFARGERFWDWWDKLNHRIYFDNYQFGEQDTLNIIFHYGDLKSKLLDFDYGDNWHGLIHKGQWHKVILKDNQLVLPKEEGICDKDKVIRVIHWAGGDTVKMNFYTYFNDDVVKYLQNLISDKEK